ncbi:MAG: right-handed parallel beta-helix repeat-containing protein [Phycisphaerales bacterium]|nr:right-handed parallel beta-helix repeat-containing protein [Phycisphaerales bacterium]
MHALAGHRLCALAMSAAFVIGAPALSQTTYYVNGSCGNDVWTGLSPVCEAPNGPKATIQAGIDAASDFDTVILADGLYTGEGNRGILFREKELSLRSSGGPEQCIIDCELADLAFDFCHSTDDRPVLIEGVTIRRGKGIWAGGICIANADVEIRDCIIEQCAPLPTYFGTTGGVLINGSSVVLIQNTAIRGNSSDESAGGIRVESGAMAFIDSSVIEGNEAVHAAGGIFVDASSAIHISRCVISQNLARGGVLGFGGGIDKFSDGRPSEPLSTIRSTLFAGNAAIREQSEGYTAGGGAFLRGRFILLDCEFVDNEATRGAGLCVAGDSFQIADVLIRDNRAEEDGGGVWVFPGSAGLFERVRLVGNEAGRDGGAVFGSTSADRWSLCEFIDNVAGHDGGAMHAASLTGDWLTFRGNRAGRHGGAAYLLGDTVLNNSLVVRNDALDAGGGLYAQAPPLRLTGATIALNTSSASGGGVHIASEGGGDSLIVNSILHANGPDALFDGSQRVVVERSIVTEGWPGVGNLDADPKFADPTIDDFRLGPASPGIDSGDNTQAATEWDLDGDYRFRDDRGMPDAGHGEQPLVDMGCYEFQGETEAFVAVHPQPGLAGRSNQFQAAGATPQARISFVYGLNVGLTAVPGCSGLNVEIANPRLVGQAVADRDGDVELTLFVPAAASGRMILLQAVDRQACAVSNLVGYRFP